MATLVAIFENNAHSAIILKALKEKMTEQEVRDTLKNRPAGLIYSLSQDAQRVFAGLYNGALNPGTIASQGGRPFFGKAECEWNWPKPWNELVNAGLIEYQLTERPNHPAFGGITTLINWSITNLGHEVRRDDLIYFDALMKNLGVLM